MSQKLLKGRTTPQLPKPEIIDAPPSISYFSLHKAIEERNAEIHKVQDILIGDDPFNPQKAERALYVHLVVRKTK